MIGSGDRKFFDAFNTLSEKMHEASGLLLEMMKEYARPEESAHRIKSLEHECDRVTADLIRRCHKTFITPLDREDIHSLATKLDDVMDLIDNTADRMIYYGFKAPPPEMEQMADILRRQTAVLKEAVGQLRKTDHILEKCGEIHALESQGDRVFHEGIARLFNSVPDPIEVIKQKDILQTVERATDLAQEAAVVLEGISLKNA